MKFINIIIIIFIFLTNGIKADSKQNQILDILQKGGNLIFIRHAYAPGNCNPDNFNINDCDTQRNLSDLGREQSKKIGNFFNENEIPIDFVLSSEWCRCKETALIAFNIFETKNFLNSFYEERFSNNKENHILELKKYIDNWSGKKNLVFITHYVVISEVLNVYASSGEIVISDKNYNVIGNLNSAF